MFSYKPKPTSALPPDREDIKKAFNDLKIYEPVLAEDKIPVSFTIPTVLSLMPMVAGAACSAMCPHLGTLLPILPDLTHSTIVYTALHCSLYTGVHWGLAAAVYDPASTGVEAKRNRYQFVLASLGPCFLWISLSSMMIMPYNHARFLNNLGVIGIVYLATLIADTVYVRDYKLVPKWYRDYKVYVTLTALGSIFALAYGCFRFPEQNTRQKKLVDVKSLSEIIHSP